LFIVEQQYFFNGMSIGKGIGLCLLFQMVDFIAQAKKLKILSIVFFLHQSPLGGSASSSRSNPNGQSLTSTQIDQLLDQALAKLRRDHEKGITNETVITLDSVTKITSSSATSFSSAMKLLKTSSQKECKVS
jgi:hypothetical protein